VPAEQKIAVSTTNTPTTAQLVTIPWKLPTRYRNNASWLLHPTSAEKIAALTHTNGDAVWPEPGPNGRGLLGWPAYVVDGLPDPATAGTGTRRSGSPTCAPVTGWWTRNGSRCRFFARGMSSSDSSG
jgi:HK97 family phage major capsid protein